MLLNLEDRKIVLQVMGALFQSRPDFQAFLKNETGATLDRIAPSPATLDVSFSETITNAERNFWLPKLIAALHDAAGPEGKAELDSETLRELIEETFHWSCWVDDYPLVNRGTLRTTLKNVAGGSGKRIVLLNGKRAMGNSHALLHLHHVTSKYGIPLAEIALREYVSGEEEVAPFDLGGTIAHALELELPASLDAKASRWSLNFLNWLAPHVMKPETRLWIAIDDFEQEKLLVKLPEPIYEFVLMLTERVGKMWPNVRLFLINYNGSPLPNLVKPRVAEETVKEITDDDLFNFFIDFYGEKQLKAADPEAIGKDAVERSRKVRLEMKGPDGELLSQMRDALVVECNDLLNRNAL
jgi:hypothetical protein